MYVCIYTQTCIASHIQLAYYFLSALESFKKHINLIPKITHFQGSPTVKSKNKIGNS